MFSPGSKGWISKYFALVEEGEIQLESGILKIPKARFRHLFFSKTGILFGYPSEFIFAKNQEDSKNWTIDEQLKLLLFESLLATYKIHHSGKVNPDVFCQVLLDFYAQHDSRTIMNMLTFFMKESKVEKLEKILEKRTEVKKNIIEHAFWVNYISNTFVYLDVLLFDEYLSSGERLKNSNYHGYAKNALIALGIAAYADGVLDKGEKQVLDIFLASAKINEREKGETERLFSADTSLEDIDKDSLNNILFKYFILDLSILVIYATHDAALSEKNYLKILCDYLDLPAEVLDESRIMVEHFVLRHNDQISFLSNANTVEQLYGTVSKRWIKILGRNKDKLALEIKQSKELVYLIKKSTKEELTKEEKEKVKAQFMDIVKSMPALAIFMLPGGALLLPLVLKIIPDLVPSAFRDNEIEPGA